MTKVDIKRLDSVTKNDTTATERINDNFKALQEAIENTLSRDGTGPNYMDADLDMNSYRIINSADPTEDNDIVNLKYVEERIGGAVEASKTAVSAAAQAANNAQSALVSSTNAINALRNAENTINQATELLTNTQEYVDAAKADIDSTVETGKQEINTTIDDAQMSLSDTINQAVEDVKTEAVNAANAVIEEAGATATQIATNNINDYTMNTVVPQLNTFVESTEADAKSADEDAKAAEDWAKTSKIWATGSDDEVQEVEKDEHSSRTYANFAMALANAPENVPVLESTLLATDVVKGPKGDSGEAEFSGDVHFEGSFNVTGDDNHPVKVTSMAGTSASGFQVVDSLGAGESDFEHYATGDRYGTRITNHNNTNDTSVSIDLYQTNVGKSVLDATAVDTVLVKDLQVDGADVVKTSGDQTISGVKTFTNRLLTADKGVEQLYSTDKASASYTLDNVRAFRADGVTSWFFVGAQKQNNTYYQRMGIWNDANTDFAAINVGFDSNGNKFTYAPTPPASDNSTQIATTAFVNNAGAVVKSKSLANNGYVKFSSGLIIQWGLALNGNVTTFPTPFTSATSWAITTGYCGAGSTDKMWGQIHSRNNTSFDWVAADSSEEMYWIAIGY